MRMHHPGLVVIAGVVAVLAIGCAHRGIGPFTSTPVLPTREAGRPPVCFTGPLAKCIGDAPRWTDEERLASRWWYPFQADLNHRVCRGDAQARRRLLDGVRLIEPGTGSETVGRIYLGILDGCSAPGFCEWALSVAADTGETPPTRALLFEAARRGCEAVSGRERLEEVAAPLGVSLAAMPPWTTNTRDARCSGLTRVESPWDDLAAVQSAGCLDLGEWLERHREDAEGTAAALQRCVEGHEIRYREADCLRELAGLDRGRALAWLRNDSRRGWGMSSAINRYAKTLLRFPRPGQLEAELVRLGLLPAQPVAEPAGGPAAILPAEVLERAGRLARFNPSCALRYCEHAPLMYRLADLTSPVLDDLIIEERWPALEAVDLGSGAQKVSTSVRGIPVTFQVSKGEDGEPYDQERFQQLRGAVEQALEQPHELIVYTHGEVYRLPVRYLGEWIDVETMVGALNTILADRHSELRLVTLAPHCIPCARVLAGPRDGLIEAAFSGVIEVVDPFNELWTLPSFDPDRL
ncbi:MAG: hypothetical protein LJE95_07075 [Acidobacteria bacterium]|nr:hypothetical protein [Acidobacteriota bacterium]